MPRLRDHGLGMASIRCGRSFLQFEARHAENELLQQFFAYGIAGVVMLCGLYGSLLRSIRHLMPGSIKTIFISILLFIFIRGFAEAEPFDLLLPMWAITVISSLVAALLSSEQSGGHLRSTDANSEGMLLQLRKGSTL